MVETVRQIVANVATVKGAAPATEALVRALANEIRHNATNPEGLKELATTLENEAPAFGAAVAK